MATASDERNDTLTTAHTLGLATIYLETSPKDYYATNLEHTGRAVWFAGENLCAYCADNLEDFRDSTVLEIGSGTGVVGIGLAKALGDTDATNFVLTDGYETVIDSLRQNAARNLVSSAVGCSRLLWGSEDVAALKLEHPQGFGRILGADLYYARGQESAIDALFATVAALLSHEEGATFYLSCTRRSLDLDIVLGKASNAGLSSSLVPNSCWDMFDNNTDGMTDLWRDAIFLFTRRTEIEASLA